MVQGAGKFRKPTFETLGIELKEVPFKLLAICGKLYKWFLLST